jgi:hypothetical protein
MPLPENPELPFFAYGLFKPGQLGFDVLRDFVEESKPEHVLGDLMEKDGVPLFVDGCSKVGGVLLKFASDKAADAYQQIASIEQCLASTTLSGRIDSPFLLPSEGSLPH